MCDSFYNIMSYLRRCFCRDYFFIFIQNVCIYTQTDISLKNHFPYFMVRTL